MELNKIESDRVYSEFFELGTYTWWDRSIARDFKNVRSPAAWRRRLLFCPRGNKPGPFSSAYLDAPEANLFPTPRVHFSLAIVNQLNSNKVVSKGKRHHAHRAEDRRDACPAVTRMDC